ncbi:hypothetical protein PHYSODRAFT_337940 [Phytophthora sojae]|uniref:Uncharacterized protein n=1 Tax=Phytophthora sojae (strain P6497) TaxID=1094619 RepID=G4ZZJ4_PHYSP|nr:hypothetical protein PHYSODRAFT_337940 [Phytophthora sojae]EGZ11194.1 hypothetical protein PHYSODRAFT_337940 [Phytophthora sojae]|eukprot:XP_009533939.1 hypothetical protein PHYSODRAFT_337940 [Phytophthora sojae]
MLFFGVLHRTQRNVASGNNNSEATPLVYSEFCRHSLSLRDKKFKRKGDTTASERPQLADCKRCRPLRSAQRGTTARYDSLLLFRLSSSLQGSRRASARMANRRHESVEGKYAWQDLKKKKKVKVSNSSFYIKSSTSPNAHWRVLDAMGASAAAAVGAFAGRALLAE